MSRLVLSMRQGDTLFINGAKIVFPSKTKVELANHAKFVFGKQVMFPEEADTPLRKLYLMLQNAYAGQDELKEESRLAAEKIVSEIRQASSSSITSIVENVWRLAANDNYFEALKILRPLTLD